MSEQNIAQMHPADELERLLNTYRIDLWFSGHTHHGFDHKSRHPQMFEESGATTFVQVASISKRINSNKTQSRFMSLVEGIKEVLIRSRDHDIQAFDESLDTVVSLHYPVSLTIPTSVEPSESVTTWGRIKESTANTLQY